MLAKPDDQALATVRVVVLVDGFCDHLLVVDHKLAGDKEGDAFRPEAVVGCYRLLRQEVANQNGGFYTASEFDIEPLLKRAGPDMQFLELGRSCVLPPYRNRPTVELLWHGIANSVASPILDVMFGCEYFESTALNERALQIG